jgi:hypothetical protein
LVLGPEQVNNSIAGRIIHKCDEVASSLHSRGGCWPPDVCVNLVPEVLRWDTGAQLGHGDASGMCINAHLAVCFGCIGIQYDTLDGTTLDEFVGAGDGNVPKVTMQLHG